jgi:uncharacterized membrane protein
MEFLAQLHPRIVHFPIALFILYFFFELSGAVLKKDFLVKSAYIILIVGVVLSVAAALTGNQAQTAVTSFTKENAQINSLIEQHENFATITLWYFFSLLILRTYLLIKKRFNGNVKYIFVILGLIGCFLIYMTGIRGGELVFKHGVGTEIIDR